jgi:hypothetical protein
MAKFLKGFLDNLFTGALNPKGNLADYAHAARLFTDDSFRLAPKQKFLYHVSFNINNDAAAIIPNFSSTIQEELNMLVKSVDLPKFQIDTTTKQQYNKKRKLQTKIVYDPINIVFHDDNYGVTTAMWEMYYRYYFKDGNYGKKNAKGVSFDSVPKEYSRGNQLRGTEANTYKFGLDNDSFNPFFRSIQIYQMARKRYTCYTLVNPVITAWQHDTMASGSPDPASNMMTIEYETVFYSRGPVQAGNNPKGFATRHYDRSPSPLSLAGGGTTSLFGVGGVLGGVLGNMFGLNGDRDAFTDIESGRRGSGSLLKTAIETANRVRNFKKLSKEGARQEGYQILKDSIESIGKGGVGGLANTVFPKNTSQDNNVTNASLKRTR